MALGHVPNATGCWSCWQGSHGRGDMGAGRDLALPFPDSPFQPRPELLEAFPNGAEEQQYLCPTVLLEEAPADEEDNHSSHDNQGKGSLEVEPTGRNKVAQVGWRRHTEGQKHQGRRITDS